MIYACWALESFEKFQKTKNEFYLNLGTEFVYLSFLDAPEA
jgi:hypothetical protein